MDLRIEGKVALVTAASKGLGKAVAIQLVSEGANVVICSRNLESLQKTKFEIKKNTNKEISIIACDVKVEKQVKQMIDSVIQEYGTIDILITNAGGPPAGSFSDFRVEDYRNAVELNLLSTISLCQKSGSINAKTKMGQDRDDDFGFCETTYR